MGQRSDENFSKNVDFSLRSSHATTQTDIWKCTFFSILEHYVWLTKVDLLSDDYL